MIDGKYICPICDRRMDMKHYCSYCKSFVREPVYYTGPVANERKEELVHYQREVEAAKKTGRRHLHLGGEPGRTAGRTQDARQFRPAGGAGGFRQTGGSRPWNARQAAPGGGFPRQTASRSRPSGGRSVWVVLAGLFLIVTVVTALFQTVSAVLMYGQMGMLAYVPWGAVCAQILVRYLPLILIEIVIIILARRKGSK